MLAHLQWDLKNLAKPYLVIKNSDGNSDKDTELSRDAKAM